MLKKKTIFQLIVSLVIASLMFCFAPEITLSVVKAAEEDIEEFVLSANEFQEETNVQLEDAENDLPNPNADLKEQEQSPYKWKSNINSTYTGLAQEESGTWYYVVNGNPDLSYTNLVQYYGSWYYVSNGIIDWSYTGLVPFYGTTYYVKNGKLDWNFSGLFNYKGTWYYLRGGRVDTGFSNLLYYAGNWFYVKNGQIDWNYSNLVYYAGTWYYVHNGIIDWKCTTLSQVNGSGTWYYIKNGKIDWNYTGLFQYYNTWYYIEKGRLNWSYNNLVYYSGNWFYVKGGRIDWTYSNLVKYGNTWYYVHNGKIEWNYTTLSQVNSSGTWYYVRNAVIDWNYTGLFQYDDTWYYVEKGRVNWNYTGLYQYGGNWYFIEDGRLNWNYTGICDYNDTWFFIKNGQIDWSYYGILTDANSGEQIEFANGKVVGVWWNVPEAYTAFNNFRSEPGNQWYWSSDNITKVLTIGLTDLIMDPSLESVARERAKEQWIQFYQNGKVTHDRPDGSSCWSAYPEGSNPCGENLSWGYFSANSVIDAWAETNQKYEGQGHRRNMLNPDATRVGIACYEKDGFTCWAMCLGY